MSSFHKLLPFFECKQIIFLNFFPFIGKAVFEAAILAYKQKTRLEVPPIKFLIHKIKAPFIPNSMSLPRLARFLHVSEVLRGNNATR